MDIQNPNGLGRRRRRSHSEIDVGLGEVVPQPGVNTITYTYCIFEKNECYEKPHQRIIKIYLGHK